MSCNKCNQCGENYNPPLNCNCEEQQTPPEYQCAGEECSEILSDSCIIHTGESIRCTDDPDDNIDDAYSNYPDVIHHILLKGDTPSNRKLTKGLSNINEQFCYLFSKEFISRFLTLIDTDTALKTQFCQMVCSCNCEIAQCNAPVVTKTIDCETDTATYTWSPVSGATSYEYQWNEVYPSASIITGITSSTSYDITGVTDGKCVKFKVRTLCSDGGVSVWSNELESCCPDTSTCNNVPNNFTVHLDCIYTHSIWFTWDLDTSPTSYDVEWYKVIGGVPGSPVTTSVANTTTQYTFNNISIGECVFARIRKVCPDGSFSPWTSWQSACCG